MVVIEAWLPEPELAEGQYGDFYDDVIIGSGLACLVPERMPVGYGQKTIFSFTAWSRLKVATDVVKPYNIVWCGQSILEHARCLSHANSFWVTFQMDAMSKF